MNISHIDDHLVAGRQFSLLLIIQYPQNEQDNRLKQLHVIAIVILRIRQLHNAVFLVDFQPVPQHRQTQGKLFPVFHDKIVIPPCRLIPSAHKAGTKQPVTDPCKFILIPLQHAFQKIHIIAFLSCGSHNL